MRNFRNYDVWIDSLDFVEKIYTITAAYPVDEKYGLVSQTRRSAVSVPSNIAEGSSRKSNLEFSRFIEIALGSAFELETQLIISANMNYISPSNLESVLNALHSLQRRLNAFRTALATDR